MSIPYYCFTVLLFWQGRSMTARAQSKALSLLVQCYFLRKDVFGEGLLATATENKHGYDFWRDGK